MLRLICDKCLKGEVFEPCSAPDHYKGFIHPETKKTVDLCNDCKTELHRLKEEVNFNANLESSRVSLEFWNIAIE